MQRGKEAVEYALHSFNDGPLGYRGENSSSSGDGKSDDTPKASFRHVYGHLIDFLKLLEPS